MNINILRYSLFDIAGGQEVDHTFLKFVIRAISAKTITLTMNNYLLDNGLFGQTLWAEICSVNGTN